MTVKSGVVTAALTVVGVLMLSACAPLVSMPDRLSDVHEAYPDSASMSPPHDKRDAYERAVMPAPYPVVYRAAVAAVPEMNLSLGGWPLQLVSSDKARGVILATAINPNAAPEMARPWERRYFFSVRLSEQGPKRTEVLIMVKAQQFCVYTSPTGFTNFLTAGIATPIALAEKEKCETYSRIHWASELDNDKALLGRYLSAVRATLVKVGYD